MASASISPDLSLERVFATDCGVLRIAGIDEAGRGALAGPVFAAAVLIPFEDNLYCERLAGVRDSKLLTPPARESAFKTIQDCVPAFGIGYVSADWIDRYGIMSATRQAVSEAIARLAPSADALLVDGPLRLAAVNLPQRTIIRGDRQSLSIAAASILAKVSRDRYMIELARRYPDYGFDRHKGYGTAEHLRALGRVGPCPEHRRSFAPLRKRLI